MLSGISGLQPRRKETRKQAKGAEKDNAEAQRTLTFAEAKAKKKI
jgi:hypothetical protein